MKFRLSRRFRRFSLKCLLAAAACTAAGNLSLTQAEEYGSIEECGQFLSPCAFEFRQVEFQDELCGWTHDSCPILPAPVDLPAPVEAPAISDDEVLAEAEPVTLAPIAPAPIAPAPIASRTSSQFDQSMAAAAATACAKAGISIEQMVEPFAMVGPQVVESLESVQNFQDWWRDVVKNAITPQEETRDVDQDTVTTDEVVTPELESVTTEDEADNPIEDSVVSDDEAATPEEASLAVQQQAVDAELDVDQPATNEPSPLKEQLDELAQEEPLDTESLGVSVLVTDEPEAVQVEGAATTQVGASAIIVSIEDTYLPYDLSARELQVWSVFPMVTDPFCVRSDPHGDVVASMWDEYESSASDTPVAAVPEVSAEEKEFVDASADCLLDEFVWDVQQVIDRQRERIAPVNLGNQLAKIIINSTRVAENAAGRLANVWPEQQEGDFDDQTAGDQLLVRAGAIEAAEPVEAPGLIDVVEPMSAVPAAQIAEVPSASQLR